MDALMEWLRQIVLVVLAAVILDLILPSSVMQRYARMVMGLMIISVMLQPLLKVMDPNFDLSSISWQGVSNKIGSVQEFQEKGHQIQEAEQQQASEEWKQKLEDLIREQAEQAGPIHVKQVQVDLTPSENTNGSSAAQALALQLPKIQKVVLTIEEAQKSDQPGLVKPIQEVRIEVTPPAEKNRPESKAQIDGTHRDWERKIQAALSDRLQIPTDHIEVKWITSVEG